MQGKSATIIAGIAAITLLYLVYLAVTYESPAGTTTVTIDRPVPVTAPDPVIEQPKPLPQATLPATREPAAAVIDEPVIIPEPEEVVVEEATEVVIEEEIVENVVPLPSLNDSDGFVITGLRGLRSGIAFLRFIATGGLIRNFVVYVENVSRGTFPQLDLPYQRVEQEMDVRELDENLYVMDRSSYRRFDALISAFVAVDVEQSVALFRTMSPLFQSALTEIGYRDRDFNQVMIEAINVVIGTAEVEGPFQLVKPSVMYLYADASIENLPEVHKQLLRIGPENTAKLKARLAEFRDSLMSQ